VKIGEHSRTFSGGTYGQERQRALGTPVNVDRLLGLGQHPADGKLAAVTGFDGLLQLVYILVEEYFDVDCGWIMDFGF
jgi:hypothetical protein